MSVGQRLRWLRGTKTLQEFAEPLGIVLSGISNIESGRSKMSLDLAEKISEVYGCTLDWLIKGVGTWNGQPENDAPAKQSIDVVTIPKDELLDLYRRLDRKNTEEIQKKEAKIEELEQNLEKAKNV
ncbi:helix-turn-helix domain-containing protein [Runella zeae]|uniref:helix-turn-helix domain-containing protein n=1 Tax=Runella zeae TaxID=94255 RepID=UPI00055A95E1|nr:helix-turn-helix transcriptional regulator [Runella zeae]